MASSSRSRQRMLDVFGVPADELFDADPHPRSSVDRILDMSRTTVNVCGDLTATAFVATSEGVWDASHVPSLERKLAAASRMRR